MNTNEDQIIQLLLKLVESSSRQEQHLENIAKAIDDYKQQNKRINEKMKAARLQTNE
jgi:predicted deacetylase